MKPANAHKERTSTDAGRRFPRRLPRYRRGRPLRSRASYRTPKREVSETVRSFDPLARAPGREAPPSVVTGAGYLFFALLFHGVVLGTLVLSEDGKPRLALPEQKETVVVRMTEPKFEKPTPVPEPEVIEEEALPVTPKPAKKATPLKTARKRPAVEAPESAAADPVDMAAATPEAPARRRMVGISFESTLTEGNGPAYAVGNTRMGQTGKGSGKKPLAPLPKGRTRGTTVTPNKVASLIPTDGVTLTKPKRLSALQPEYPTVLKAQGVEGNVVVRVTIDEDGRVTNVRVVKGSGYDALDASARNAASRERFTPAMRNGEPIAYTLKYTYRFRVREG